MAINIANCLKIETAGLLIGWTYFFSFAIGFLAILTASLIGIYLYISAGDGVLIALLIFFIMVTSLIITGVLTYFSKDFVDGVKNQSIKKVRRFKYLIGILIFLAFISLIIALVGSTQTFRFQEGYKSPTTPPPLGLEYVIIALVIFSLHVGIFVIIDIVQKKFNHIEMRREIYKENSNINIVSYQPRPREIHMKVPDVELPPPPPSKY